MRKFALLFILIITTGIVSCTTSGNTISSEQEKISIQNQPSSLDDGTITPAATETPSPIPTATYTETVIPTATPMGGKPLRISYLSFDCEDIDSENCIIVADFFTNEIKFKIPLNSYTTKAYMSWSPDGKYLLYTDSLENYVNAMLLDVETQESIVIDTYLLRAPTVLVSDTGSVKTYSVTPGESTIGFSTWSPDRKYVAFTVGFSEAIFVYSIEDHEIKRLNSNLRSFYWLDDSEHLLEIETGQLYNVKTQTVTTIPIAKFMNASYNGGDFIQLAKGDSSYYPDTVSLLPLSNDIDRLMEEGTQILYENELIIAKAYQENPNAELARRYEISVNNYFIQGNEIILSGYLRHEVPWMNKRYIKFGKMDELPLIISEDDLFEGEIFMISPDEKYFFGSDVVWNKDIVTEAYTRISLIDCFDLETKQLIHSYDLHTLASDPHDVWYMNHQNLAFYWEE